MYVCLKKDAVWKTKVISKYRTNSYDSVLFKGAHIWNTPANSCACKIYLLHVTLLQYHMILRLYFVKLPVSWPKLGSKSNLMALSPATCCWQYVTNLLMEFVFNLLFSDVVTDFFYCTVHQFLRQILHFILSLHLNLT